MKNRKYYSAAICALLIFALLLSGCGSTKTADTPEPAETPEPVEISGTEPPAEPFSVAVREFNKRGNVILDTTFEALGEKDIEPGDVISVTAGESVYELPVGTSYSDVDSGCMLCRFDPEDAEVTLAINGGSFAETAGMAVKETIEEEPGYRWDVRTDTVTLVLKEKGGYLDEYSIRSLERTNERGDYSALSDRDFANYRAISTTGLKADTVYRGSTPLDPELGRNTYIMTFLGEDGIRTVLNLADSKEEMKAFEAYADSYYASCSIWNAEMDYQYDSEAFAAKVKDCVLFLLENEGPYFIHCKEGKDRTGILCAILESFLGASYEEIKDDYIRTYINFFRIEEGGETYDAILRSSFDKTLCAVFGIAEPESADLQYEAREYLLSAGLTEDDLAALTAGIGA